MPPRPVPAPHAAPADPAPAPVAAPAPAPVEVPAAEVSDPSQWGRVDEEGTVYVRTAEGERAVGSWQAGEPAAGLAHYGRRYDDLATEVSLLEARLKAHTGNPGEIKNKAQGLAESIPTAAAVGDLDGLAARARAMVDTADSAAAESRAEKAAARSAQIARKEALAVEAEQIAAESTSWKAAGDRLKAIVEEWKTIRGIDRKTDEALWTRFAAARDAFGRRRGAHFASLDAQRGEARAAKQELIKEAQKLATSTDWGPTSAAMRSLMDRWKAVPRTGRDGDDDLWKEFRAAQDVFFAARAESDKKRTGEEQANQAAEGGTARRGREARPDDRPARRSERPAQDPGALRRGRARPARRHALAGGPDAGRRAEGARRHRHLPRPHRAGEPDGDLHARRRHQGRGAAGQGRGRRGQGGGSTRRRPTWSPAASGWPRPRSPPPGGDARLAALRAGRRAPGAPILGMPSRMPGVEGRVPASLASPARVRRCESRAPSATRKCGLASVTTVSTTSPGRTPSAAVKCTSRPSRARPDSRPVAASLLPSPAATSSSTCRPTSARFSAQLISSCRAVSRR